MTRKVWGPGVVVATVLALLAFSEPAAAPDLPASRAAPSYKANCFREVGGSVQPCHHDGVAWAKSFKSI